MICWRYTDEENFDETLFTSVKLKTQKMAKMT